VKRERGKRKDKGRDQRKERKAGLIRGLVYGIGSKGG
jgi:hypothetical protein